MTTPVERPTPRTLLVTGAIEFAIQFLLDIKRLCPSVLKSADIDSAIARELSPALVPARTLERELAAANERLNAKVPEVEALWERFQNTCPRPLDEEVFDLARDLGGRIAALKVALAEAQRDAEQYWPFVEMVAKDRLPPTMQDVADAMTMHNERKRAALAKKE